MSFGFVFKNIYALTLIFKEVKMSAYTTTMCITRHDALKEIVNKLFYVSDFELEDILFDLFGEETLHNFSIVEGYDKNQYCKYDGFIV